MARLHVGTSGWQYRHWAGVLYPEGLPASAWLEAYARHFDTVEVNATFYRLPTPSAVDGWRNRSPHGFVFAVKGSRWLTHMKRLLDEGPDIARFYDPVGRLERKLGPVLWQLPPGMKPDVPRLERWLARLPPGKHAVEFRDPAWYSEEACEVLDRHGAAFCEHDRVDRPPPRLTGGWRYVRFHGLTGHYHGLYGRDRLLPWARDLLAWQAQDRDAWVYFNNDLGGSAVWDALELKELLGHRARPLAPEAAPS